VKEGDLAEDLAGLQRAQHDLVAVLRPLHDARAAAHEDEHLARGIALADDHLAERVRPRLAGLHEARAVLPRQELEERRVVLCALGGGAHAVTGRRRFKGGTGRREGCARVPWLERDRRGFGRSTGILMPPPVPRP
jgi:hypothetical protein